MYELCFFAWHPTPSVHLGQNRWLKAKYWASSLLAQNPANEWTELQCFSSLRSFDPLPGPRADYCLIIEGTSLKYFEYSNRKGAHVAECNKK